MEIGFTGTRLENFITMARLVALRDALLELKIQNSNCVLRHGDCVGADAIAWRIAKHLGIRTIAHPPINEKYRAFTQSDVILEPKDYIPRDHDIVDASQILIAVPRIPFKEELRSGTWATVRYARKKNIKVIQL